MCLLISVCKDAIKSMSVVLRSLTFVLSIIFKGLGYHG